MIETLLPTKLYLPLSRSDWVIRPRLLARLDAARAAKLVLVSAPAGYGKTTLVTAWLRRIAAEGNVHIGWLALDEADNDPRQFFRYLAAIVAECGEGRSSLTQMVEAEQLPPPTALMAGLIRDVAACAAPLILVLDDYHLLDAVELDAALAFLLEHMPPQMTLVLTSRSDPGFPVARLRARGELIEIRAEDLRFTPAETQQFLRQTMALSLSEEQAHALEERTEGWVAGLQMAALSMQTRSDDDLARFVAGFAGSHRYILDYLVDEALGGQPARIRNFLLATSILERLSGPLCAAVTECEDAQEILASLEHDNLFVIPLDDRRRWYRYHHLFADVLRAYAGMEQADRMAIWHGRASRWYAAMGMPVDAIRHALPAGDVASAADLLERIRPEIEGDYQLAAWLNWIRALPLALVEQRPVLCAGYAWALLETGELSGAGVYLRQAEQRVQEPPSTMVIADPTQWETLPASLAGARAYLALATGDVEESIDHARRALDLSPDDTAHQWRRVALSLLGLTEWMRGNLVEAARSFTDLTESTLRLGKIVDAASTSYVLAEMHFAQGDLSRGEAALQRMLKEVERSGGTPPGTCDLYRALAIVTWERNREELALRQLETAARLGPETGLTNWSYRLSVTRAEIQRSRGDFAGALAQLDEATRLFVENPLPITHPVDALKARIWIAQDRLDDAEQWARAQALTPDGDLSYLREFEHFTLARLLLSRHTRSGDRAPLEDASRLLLRLQRAAEAAGRMGSVLQSLILQALVHDADDNPAAASRSLEQALALAEPRGYIRHFIDEGSALDRLLRAAVGTSARAVYIKKILAAAGNQDPASTAAAGSQYLIEPLTEREQEILVLIAAGLKNKEIAEQLVISLNTVLYHTKNLYGKLGVNKRARAIAKGRELDLIE